MDIITYVDGTGCLNGVSLAGSQARFVCVSDDIYVQLSVPSEDVFEAGWQLSIIWFILVSNLAYLRIPDES